MRIVPEYYDSSSLYWLSDSLFISVISIYIFNKSEKKVISMMVLFGLLIFSFHCTTECILQMAIPLFTNAEPLSRTPYSEACFPYVISFLISLVVFIFINKNRYEWRRLTGDKYDPNKVQAIYSKPNSVLALLGATGSLSPKCNVRFSYGGKTIRFKKSSSMPVMVDTSIKKTDIIEDIECDGNYFYKRWDDIKVKKYNLLTFNCRSLIKINGMAKNNNNNNFY